MRRYLIVLAIMLAILATGCSKKPAAIVNGAKISRGALQWNISERIDMHKATGAEVEASALRSVILDQMITDKLLYQGSVEKGIAVDDHNLDIELHSITKRMGEENFEKRLKETSLSREEFAAMTREKIAANKFTDALAAENAPTDEDIKNFYKSNTTPFLTPESVNIKFIQTQNREQAEDILKDLEKGKNFDRLADQLSKDDKAIVNGYGWTNPDFFRPEIAEGIKDIRPGHYDGPFKSDDVYFIFRVKDRKYPRAKTFEEAKDEIKAILEKRNKKAAVAHWLVEKREKADIKIN